MWVYEGTIILKDVYRTVKNAPEIVSKRAARYLILDTFYLINARDNPFALSNMKLKYTANIYGVRSKYILQVFRYIQVHIVPVATVRYVQYSFICTPGGKIYSCYCGWVSCNGPANCASSIRSYGRTWILQILRWTQSPLISYWNQPTEQYRTWNCPHWNTVLESIKNFVCLPSPWDSYSDRWQCNAF